MSVNVLASRPRTLIAAAIVASMGVGIAVGAIAAQPHMTVARGYLDQALGEQIAPSRPEPATAPRVPLSRQPERGM